MPWVDRSYLRYFPTLTWQSDPQVAAVLRRVPSGARIIDLGSGGRRVSPGTVCVDFIPFHGTDLVGDVQKLPVRDGVADLVLATGLIEHVEDDWAVLQEVVRVLRPGGYAHIELPFLQQYHEDPIDCRRFTVQGLERELRRVGLEPVQSGSHIGPTVTLITLSAYYASLWFEGKSRMAKVVSTGVFFAFSVLLWPLKFLDSLLIRKRSAHRLAFGVFCTARKPQESSQNKP